MNLLVDPAEIARRQVERVGEFAARLLSPSAYERVRELCSEDFAALRSRRRIRVGPSLSLLFENDATVLIQIYEVLRVEGWTPRRAARELAAYRCLLPGPRTLCATALIDGDGLAEGLSIARGLRQLGGLVLRFDGRSVASAPAERSTDGGPGEPVHFLRWDLSATARAALLAAPQPLTIALRADVFSAATELPPTLKAELADDLLGQPPPHQLLASAHPVELAANH